MKKNQFIRNGRIMEVLPGFNLDTELTPKPNRVNLSKPERIDGKLHSKIIKD